MAWVKKLLHRPLGRLLCDRSSRPGSCLGGLVTVAASAAAVAGEETVLGSAQPLALGTDGAPPEWIRLIPPGTFSLNDGRGPYHNRTPDRVIANTKTSLAGREANGDYDHATEYVSQTGQPAIAAGWIKDWRVTDGAIEARVEWTKNAAAQIAAKEWKYVSPVFDTAKSTGEVVRIRRFALTNNPAIDALPAIAASRHNNPESNVLSKMIAQVLGLPETASDAEIVAGVTAAKKNFDAVVASAGARPTDSVETIVAHLRDKPDAAKWIAAKEYQRVSGELATVTASRDELAKKAAGAEVETVIADALKAGKLTPKQKEYWTEVCAAQGSAEPLKKFLVTAPVIVKPGEEVPGAVPGGETQTITAAQLNAAEQEHCRKYGLKPESYARELTRIIAAGGTRPLAN